MSNDKGKFQELRGFISNVLQGSWAILFVLIESWDFPVVIVNLITTFSSRFKYLVMKLN